MIFIRKSKFELAKRQAYDRGFKDGQAKSQSLTSVAHLNQSHPDSFELQLESYCDGCSDFEPFVERSVLYVDNRQYGPTIIRCVNYQRCAAISKNIGSRI